MSLRVLNHSDPVPDGFRDLTEAEMKVARQIASTIVRAGEKGIMLHQFTTKCINLYDLPTSPPNSKGRLLMFQLLLQVAQELIKEHPPPAPNSWASIRHIIDWTGDY
jgi:hypothetical protein